MARKKKNRALVVAVLLILAGAGYVLFQQFFSAKVRFKDKSYTYIYVGKNDSFENVIEKLEDEGVIENPKTFIWLAEKMDLPDNVHPGRYRIINGLNMRQIINLIKYNKHEKVKLTFNSQIRDLEEFAQYTDEKLEISADEIWIRLNDEKFLAERFDLDPDNAFAMVMPGTLEVNWAIHTDSLMKIFTDRYKRVWNFARLSQAKKLGFKPAEIITIASIVQSESAIMSEQEKIAGVYINRLKKGMPLQADPTLTFANKNHGIRRVLNGDKEINSPYNTYKFKGLPPGPICIVTTKAIDATLNYSRHNFIYFCAKPQLNGFSDYSSTYEEHRKFALAYRRSLDSKGISR